MELLTSYLFLFKGVRELKVRHENNHFGWRANFLLMAISCLVLREDTSGIETQHIFRKP